MTTNEQQRDDGIEQPDADRKRVLHEHLQVVGDALVRVVGGVAEKLHAVVIGGIEPLPQIGLRHPAPPADLQPLIEVGLIDREHGIDGGEHAEEQDGADEGVPVVVLQRIVKAIVPLVQDDLDRHERKLDRDHRRRAECGPASGPPSGNREWTAARSWRLSKRNFSRSCSARVTARAIRSVQVPRALQKPSPPTMHLGISLERFDASLKAVLSRPAFHNNMRLRGDRLHQIG